MLRSMMLGHGPAASNHLDLIDVNQLQWQISKYLPTDPSINEEASFEYDGVCSLFQIINISTADGVAPAVDGDSESRSGGKARDKRGDSWQ